MDDAFEALVYRLIDETITRDDFEKLQERIESDANAREKYLAIVGLTDALSEISLKDSGEHRATEGEMIARDVRPVDRDDSNRSNSLLQTLMQVATAAVVLLSVGCIAFWLGHQINGEPTARTIDSSRSEQGSNTRDESRAPGHATLRRTLDLSWPAGSKRYLEGDVLPNGSFKLDTGLAEIDFFCGATLIVEGPAELEIESDWSVRVAQGRLRANVPPVAQGFVVKAADSEIIDLGTEFAVEVDTGNARVQVIDGEVRLKGGDHDGRHLFGGDVAWLSGHRTNGNAVVEGLSTISELSKQRVLAQRERFDEWTQTSHRFRQDRRLIAYYPIVAGPDERVIPNAAYTGNRFDGQLVGPVQLTEARFGSETKGVNFSRLGSRVRTRIDGEFDAFTFSCWVKIENLDQRYNALFMGDGFENGEPHWQIRDDGRLMITVMVDDTRKMEHFSELEGQVVLNAGFHRNYYSDVFWDPSKCGQWMHLAVVYDPLKRRVTQFADGRIICDEDIEDELVPKVLRIGPAEIGNWGQPFRKTPEFAIRNLNGTIDELAVFDAALTDREIQSIYELGKPLGY